MFPESRFASASGEMEQVLALIGDRTPERVLDVACGPGRHAVEAARRGIAVTGVDRSAFLLSKAQDLAAQTGVAVEWVHADMREYVAPEPVDVVLNLFTSFGYFERAADNARVLANAYESLRPGGALALDVMGKEVLARIFSLSTVEDDPGSGASGGTVVQRRRVAPGWTWIDNEWTFLREGSARTFSLGHWLYSGHELTGLLSAAGFESIELFGSFEAAPYDTNAERLVAVARKPAS